MYSRCSCGPSLNGPKFTRSTKNPRIDEVGRSLVLAQLLGIRRRWATSFGWASRDVKTGEYCINNTIENFGVLFATIGVVELFTFDICLTGIIEFALRGAGRK